MADEKGHVGVGHAVELERFLAWFESHGGRISKLCLEDLGGDMSLSVVTQEAVHKGDVVMSIPISCLLYTSPSPRDQRGSRMPSSA